MYDLLVAAAVQALCSAPHLFAHRRRRHAQRLRRRRCWRGRHGLIHCAVCVGVAVAVGSSVLGLSEERDRAMAGIELLQPLPPADQLAICVKV